MASDDKLLDSETGHKGLPLKVALGWLGVFLLFVLGALLGATAGYFFGREENTIWGALIGGTLCGVIGFFAFRVFSYYMKCFQLMSPIPEWKRIRQTNFAEYDMFVTVHRCQNVMNTEGLMGFFGNKNDSFVKVEVGRIIENEFLNSGTNPAKITCVNKNSVFEECFRLRIAPTDDTLKVTLFDQDMITEELVGWVKINISKEIVDLHFPQEKGFPLRSDEISMFSREVHAGTVVLSFTPGGNFPKDTLSKHAATDRHLEAYRLEQKRQDHQRLIQTGQVKEQAPSYGTWAASNRV